MKVLITGITGFCGKHLATYVAGLGHPVYGFAQAGDGRSTAGLPLGAELFHGDVQDDKDVACCLGEAQPDAIFYLAGLAAGAPAPRDPWTYYSVNVNGALSLLRALALSGRSPAVHIASSGAIYGAVTSPGQFLDEESPYAPASAYALSKLSQDLFAHQYATCGPDIVRTRAFNIIGPGQSERFLYSALTRQVAEIEAGQREPVLRVGDWAVRHDLVDVRDAVRGYWLALTKGPTGAVYNVCSGRAWSVREVLDTLLGFSPARIRVEPDGEPPGTMEVNDQVGSYARLHDWTGWQPEVPLAQSLHDMLEEWRGKVKA
jgi:GDP-4-dehydro-6-deoxy-D-mannose reductase